MPIYGVAQAGSSATLTFDSAGNPIYTPTPGLNLTTLQIGEYMKLFDAEAGVTGKTSVAIARGNPAGSADNGITFQIIWSGTPTGSTVEIQGSNVDVDADYETLYQSVATQFDNYTDTVRWNFYRAKLTVYASGTNLTVNAKR